MNYIGYFLILEDIINYCNKEHIYIGPGRGSVAGSLIAYVIGLTEVNPLDYGLIFERFLDLGRDKATFPKMI
jgi:DNA polymerase-3 subunit alpha